MSRGGRASCLKHGKMCDIPIEEAEEGVLAEHYWALIASLYCSISFAQGRFQDGLVGFQPQEQCHFQLHLEQMVGFETAL